MGAGTGVGAVGLLATGGGWAAALAKEAGRGGLVLGTLVGEEGRGMEEAAVAWGGGGGGAAVPEGGGRSEGDLARCSRPAEGLAAFSANHQAQRRHF